MKMKLPYLKKRDLLSLSPAAAARLLMAENGYDQKKAQSDYLALLKFAFPGFIFDGRKRPAGTPYHEPYNKMRAFKQGASRASQKYMQEAQEITSTLTV